MDYKSLVVSVVSFVVFFVVGSASYYYLVVLPQQEETRVEREEAKERAIAEDQRKTEERIKRLQEEVKKATRVTKYVITNTNLLELQSYQIIRTVPKGIKVTIIEERVGWSHVEIDNQEGWLKSRYLADSISPAPDLSSIIKQWRPYVAYIKCDFRDINTHELYYRSHGSGVVRNFAGQITIITSRHLIVDNNDFQPYVCRAKLPNSNHILVGNKFIGGAPFDIAFIYINNPDEHVKGLTSPFTTSFRYCRIKPSLGDDVLILGYPVIGSREDITVTRGIISGFEGEYYITDAKIDQGNSGGAAILLKDNCFLGLPTFVRKGRIEALGRILDISAFFEIKR